MFNFSIKLLNSIGLFIEYGWNGIFCEPDTELCSCFPAYHANSLVFWGTNACSIYWKIHLHNCKWHNTPFYNNSNDIEGKCLAYVCQRWHHILNHTCYAPFISTLRPAVLRSPAYLTRIQRPGAANTNTRLLVLWAEYSAGTRSAGALLTATSRLI